LSDAHDTDTAVPTRVAHAPRPPATPATGADRRDAELVRRLLDGDEAAFNALVDAYHARLVRLARAFVRDAAAAEDVAQDTWIGVLHGLPTFEGRSSLKTWIFRILVNRAKTRGVRDARAVIFADLDDATLGPALGADRFTDRGTWAAPPAAWTDDTPEAILLRSELRGRLQLVLEALPPRQRAVLVLRDVEGLTPEDVCAMLDISEANHRVLLHRARGALYKEIERAQHEGGRP